MFKNIGGKRRFLWLRDENKQTPEHNEARIIPQTIPTTITPDERRNKMMDFARLSQKEKAA